MSNVETELPVVWEGESSDSCLDKGLNCCVLPSDPRAKCTECGFEHRAAGDEPIDLVAEAREFLASTNETLASHFRMIEVFYEANDYVSADNARSDLAEDALEAMLPSALLMLDKLVGGV